MSTLPSVILTDIEGTTTSISFVHEVLFPHSRRELGTFVAAHSTTPEVASCLDAARTTGVDEGLTVEGTDAVVALLEEWIAQDRKHPALKQLQGMIWRAGYESGAYTGHVYPEVPRRLRQFRDAGIRLAVYSSGSVPAQKLLFGHSDAGDLTPLFEAYFDTSVGHKKEAPSYAAITDALAVAAGSILFLSDVEAELDAAAASGLNTVQLVRPGTTRSARHTTVPDFDALAAHLGLS